MAFHRESGPDLVPVSSRPVQCPNCSNVVPAANVNVSALVAKCDLCGHIIQLAALNAPPEQHLEGRPSGVIEEADPGSDLKLSFCWFEPGMISLLAFCIIWNAGTIVAAVLLFTGGLAPDDDWWIPTCLIVAFGLVGSAWTYSALAGLLNKTTISIARGQLIVRHGPIWWWGNRCLQTSDLLEIELDRPRVYLDNDSPVSDDLMVSAHHKTGRRIILLPSRRERQAKYIAQQLASHLKLPLRRDYADRKQHRPLDIKQALGRLQEKTDQTREATRNDDIASTSA